MFCIKPVVVASSHAGSNSGPLHTYEQREKKVHSDLIVAFLSMLICVCTVPELENANEQETITGLI